MALTVVVLSAEGARLTFDGTQRVVIGRGAGSDVRLPDASVSSRHATLRAQGSDFVLVDEGSTNGTFVGSVRVAARTSRIVRSGDRVRVGRMWIELRIDQSAVTRDVAAATRDIALALVSRALDARGADRTTRIQVVEGQDQGADVALSEEGTALLVGRSAHCALALADADVSREHVRIERRGGAIWVRDLGTKNGTWVGETFGAPDQDILWRSPHVVRIGRTVLALVEPLTDALSAIEDASDEALDPASLPAPPPAEGEATARPVVDQSLHEAARPSTRPAPVVREGRHRAGWSATDLLVMGAALCVLALSLAGLV